MLYWRYTVVILYSDTIASAPPFPIPKTALTARMNLP